MSDRYRFDNAYGAVYEKSGRAYVFIGSYLMFGIKPGDRQAAKIGKVKKWEEETRDEIV